MDAVARRARGLFGRPGGAVLPGLLAATELGADPGNDSEASAACRKAEEKMVKKERAGREKNKVGKVKGGGETLNGGNSHTGKESR